MSTFFSLPRLKILISFGLHANFVTLIANNGLENTMDSLPGQKPDPPPDLPDPPAPSVISPVPPSNTVASITAAVSRDSSDVTARYLENRSSVAKSSSKEKKRHQKQSDDGKIESLHTRMDVVKHTNIVVSGALQYLLESQTATNKSLLQPAIKALEFATQTCGEQIERVRRDVDNTKAKKKSKQVHNKLNKQAHRQAQEIAAVTAGQARVNDKPKKTLTLIVKNAKEAVEALGSPRNSIGSMDLDSTAPLLPRTKKRKSSETNDENDTDSEGVIIRLPRPANSEMYYRPQEAAEECGPKTKARVHIQVQETNDC